METQQDRGLLDLSVELSTRDIMAGNEFTLFVLVKNPFARPIWVRRVHVSLPSELKLAVAEAESAKTIGAKERSYEQDKKKKEEAKERLEEKFELLQEQVARLTESLENSTHPDDIKDLISALENQMGQISDQLKEFSEERVEVHLVGSSIGDLKIGADAARVTIESTERQASARDIEITEPWLVLEEYARTRSVELESSLPKNTALQPGNTAVYSVVLDVRKALLFTPSQYRLQFNVNYSFKPKLQERGIDIADASEEELFTNTVAFELSIRSSVYSVITGSMIGGLVGGVARILQVGPPSVAQIFTLTNTVAILVAVILSIVAIVFLARKSDAQSFVSVEDFWGGLLVGFFVGYTGTSFFENLTGIAVPAQ